MAALAEQDKGVAFKFVQELEHRPLDARQAEVTGSHHIFAEDDVAVQVKELVKHLPVHLNRQAQGLFLVAFR